MRCSSAPGYVVSSPITSPRPASCRRGTPRRARRSIAPTRQSTRMPEPGGAVDVLAAVGLGLSAGAMLTEGAVLVPWWRSMSPESFLGWYAANAARLFWFFGPLEMASALLAVAAGVLSW